MKKGYMLFLLVFLIISIPIRVEAFCDYQELARIKKIASNVTYKVDYIEKNGTVEFSVTLLNLHPEIYFKDVTNNTFYYYKNSINNTHEIVINGYSPGKTIQYEFYNIEKEYCDNQILLNKYVTLPPYNPFYNDSVCNDAKEYKLCQKWIELNMDYNSFKQQVENYKKERNKGPVEEPIDDSPKNIDKVLDFFIEYYVYILSTIIIVCLIFIYQLNKKDNFDFS